MIKKNQWMSFGGRPWLMAVVCLAAVAAMGSASGQPAVQSGTQASSASAQCGPAAGGGTTCGETGPASANTQQSDVGAGNPINVLTGNKYQREVDLAFTQGHTFHCRGILRRVYTQPNIQ